MYFESDENSFIFKKIEDNSCGALFMENKIPRVIFLEALSKDTILFSFTPIKSGIVELDKIVFWERSLQKQLEFEINFKLLINENQERL